MMQSVVRVAALLLVVGVLAACSSDKAAPKPAVLTDIPRHAPDSVWFAEQWQHTVGNGDGDEFLRLRPAVGEAAVYVASRDGHVQALDKASGKVLWSRWTAFPFTGATSAGYGMVFAGSAKGQLVALDAATGKTRWWAGDLSAEILSAPTADANVVVAMCGDGHVYAYNRETGARLWVHDTAVPALSLRGNATPVINNGVVYIATAGGKLEAVQAADGLPQWDVRVASNLGRSDLDRVTDVDGDMLVDESSNVIFTAGFQSQMTAADLTDGHRIWQIEISNFNGLAGSGSSLFAVDSGSSVLAVDIASGKSVWKQGAMAWHGLGSPLVFGGDLLVGDADGFVHVLRLDDGAVVGRFRQGNVPILALRADDKTVYAYSADGRLGAWQRTPFPPPRPRLLKQGMSPWSQDRD